MPGLQVLSAPSNQPTLNPVVQPVNQPTLAPRVLPKPQNAPVLAPKVQSQPVNQPTLNPAVQSQPQGQGVISSTGTADNQQPYKAKLSVDEFATLIKQKYPQYADQDNGKLVKAILDKHPEYADRVYIPISAVQDKHPGIVQSIIQGIATPFARFGVTAYDAVHAGNEALKATGDAIIGNKDAEAARIKKATAEMGPRDLGYLGTVKPFGYTETQTSKGPVGRISPIRTLSDAAGAGAEVGANFIGGEGAIGAGESILKGSLKAAIKTGIKEGATAGAVAGFGSGLQQDKVSLGGVAKSTAEGLASGAVLGGAAAGIPALAVESYRFAKGVKNFVNPDVEAAFMKALKPGTNNTSFKADVNLATPILADTEKTLGKSVKNLNDLLDVVKTAKQRVWATVQQHLGNNSDLTIDGNKIADAMVSSIDDRFRLQNPAAASRIEATANTYRRTLPVSEAESFLESANNDLQNFYAKSGFKQKADARNPEIGHVVREAEALRTQLNQKISSATGKDFGLLKKQYGALTNLEQVTTKRVNVAERQNPDSLAEQISTAQGIASIGKGILNRNFGDAASGLGQMVTSHVIKNKNTSNALIEHAFNQLRKGAPKLRR